MKDVNHFPGLKDNEIDCFVVFCRFLEAFNSKLANFNLFLAYWMTVSYCMIVTLPNIWVIVIQSFIFELTDSMKNVRDNRKSFSESQLWYEWKKKTFLLCLSGFLLLQVLYYRQCYPIVCHPKKKKTISMKMC